MSSNGDLRERRDVGSKPVSALIDTVPITKAPEPTSKPSLPEVLKFPLVLILSISISELLYPLDAEFNRNALLDFSRPTFENEITPVVAVGLWKVLELTLAWFAGFDDIDMLAFTLLSHIPHAYFLRVFYLLPLQPVLIGLLTTLLANVGPFYLLRRRLPHNTPESSQHATAAITSDKQIIHIVALVATAMLALPVVASLTTWLPLHLATHFAGLRTLEPAHTAGFSTMLLALFPAGYAARQLFFTPLAASTAVTLVNKASLAYSSGETAQVLTFDPVSATLTQTIHRNVFWHRYLPPQTQVLLERTALVAGWTAANTAFKAFLEVDGAEVVGAVAWGGVWGVGVAMAAGMLGWIAGVNV